MRHGLLHGRGAKVVHVGYMGVLHGGRRRLLWWTAVVVCSESRGPKSRRVRRARADVTSYCTVVIETKQ